MQEEQANHTTQPKGEASEITHGTNGADSVSTTGLPAQGTEAAGMASTNAGAAPASDANVYSDEEEEMLTQRLKDLGYL